jgi:hypothetical protein
VTLSVGRLTRTSPESHFPAPSRWPCAHHGRSGHGLLDQVEIYAPIDGFAAISRLREPRSDHTATLLADGRVLIVGGSGLDRAVPVPDPNPDWVVSTDFTQSSDGVAHGPGNPFVPTPTYHDFTIQTGAYVSAGGTILG